MGDPPLLGKQRELVTSLRAAETIRQQQVAQAEARREAELAEAQATAEKRRKDPDERLKAVRTCSAGAVASLRAVGLSWPAAEARPAPATAYRAARPEQALDDCVAAARAAAESISSAARDLDEARAAARSARYVAVGAATVVLIAVVWGLSSAYQAWNKEQMYRSAVVALEAGEWEAARGALEPLLAADATYKDAQTLMLESYYRPALAFLEVGEWEEARGALKPLLAAGATFKDAQALMLESYYRPALAFLEVGEWGEARLQLQRLLQLDSGYRDAQILLRESYYQAATQAFEGQDNDAARAELKALIAIERQYRDALTLLCESYYQHAEAALQVGRWDEARAQLDELARVEPTYRDATFLMLESYYRPTVVAFEAGDWSQAAKGILQPRRLASSYRDTEYVVGVSSELRHALAVLYAQLWSGDAEISTRVTSWHDRVTMLALSPDGSKLASANDMGEVKVWIVASGREVCTIPTSAHSIAFCADGQTLATGGADSSVNLWDTATGRQTGKLKSDIPYWWDVKALACSPTGRELASAWGRFVELWDPDGKSAPQELPGLGEIWSLSFSEDGRLLAAGQSDSLIVWDLVLGIQKLTLKHGEDSVLGVDFSSEGNLVASCSRDGSVKVWDTSTGALLHTLRGHDGWVTSVAFHPGGQLLASLGGGDVVLWDMRSGRSFRTIAKAGATVAFTSDGRTLATASGDDAYSVMLVTVQ